MRVTSGSYHYSRSAAVELACSKRTMIMVSTEVEPITETTIVATSLPPLLDEESKPEGPIAIGAGGGTGDEDALLQPPGALSSLGHCDVMLAGQRGPLLHGGAPCLCSGAGTGRKSMGTLKPSVREMSKKSCTLVWSTVNSASV
uniref:Uncharacterized protein n=1 Tax=Oryza rufipogon TaxID=4529 RepID=A0A0E0MQK0_ORYRU